MPARLLLPRPQRLEPGSDVLEVASHLQVVEDLPSEGVSAALDRLRDSLSQRGIELDRTAASEAAVRLHLVRRDVPGGIEAYRLEVGADGIRVVAGDDAGLSHGLSTLAQWVRLAPGSAPPLRLEGVRIEDRPDLAARGVLLDVSRSRVPTMETLFELVDLLASWKVNQLQLYTEHTFAYRGHEVVWRGASPMTPDEIRKLDAYCRRRHVELVPNQNSCGHFHRWLVHEPYRALAECPQGIEHPFSREREPFGLCTTDPASLELLRELYAQLLPCFSSDLFHVGLDETLDLGRCRSRAEAERRGPTELYLSFLEGIHRLVSEHGRRMQIWGDIVAARPEALNRLPSDVIVMDWGYEAEHDFEARAERLEAAGLDFYLCPGTSSWLSFAGRLANARRNIAAAALAARRHDATGLLLTDWGDQGHLQPLPASLPGLVLGASFSWAAAAAETPDETPLADLLAAHLPHGWTEDPGEATRDLTTLADLYRLAGGRSSNASPLFYLLVRPDLPLDDRRLAGLSPFDLERCLDVLEGIGRRDATIFDRELGWMRDALAAAARVGIARLGGTDAHAPALLDALDDLIARHGPLWDARSRPGGREESRSYLERARAHLVANGLA